MSIVSITTIYKCDSCEVEKDIEELQRVRVWGGHTRREPYELDVCNRCLSFREDKTPEPTSMLKAFVRWFNNKEQK